MQTDLQSLLPRIIIAFPLGIGVVVFFTLTLKRFERFFFMDYQGNSKERFKDNLVGNVFMALGVGCLILAMFAFQEGELSWDILQISLFVGALSISIGVLGAYWRSHSANKLSGGFLPTVRERYGYVQSEPTKQQKIIDPSGIRLPPRIKITAISIAILVFFGLYFLLGRTDWHGSVWSASIFRLLVSGLAAIGTFITIASAALSRRIQKLRDGEPLDDDDDF